MFPGIESERLRAALYYLIILCVAGIAYASVATKAAEQGWPAPVAAPTPIVIETQRIEILSNNFSNNCVGWSVTCSK